MNTITKATASNKVKNHPVVHSHATGNFDLVIQKLNDEGIYGNVQGSPGRFEMLLTNQLVPLDTQRETSASWAGQRLLSQKGFNWYAAGCLSVARDPVTGQNMVMDGCGRLLQAQLNGFPDSLPCFVFDLSAKDAAKWFAYNQSKGRRSLSPEEIFVNEVESDDEDANKWKDLLLHLNLCVTISEYSTIPRNSVGYPQIKIRALKEGYNKYADKKLDIMKQARDMICIAWAKAGVQSIRQDLFWGLIVFLKEIPESRKNGFNKALQEFLSATATMYGQNKLKFKEHGGNLNNYEALSVFRGLAFDFRLSDFCKPQFAQILTKKKVESVTDKMTRSKKEKTEIETDEEA